MTVPRVEFRFIIVLLLLLGGLLHLLPAQAQDHNTEDIIRQVKAAYLFKFGNYVLCCGRHKPSIALKARS